VDTQEGRQSTAWAEPFDFEKHGLALSRWLTVYGKSLSVLEEIPKIGAVVRDNDGPIAMAFLRSIEACKSVLLDGLIANPDSSGKRRYFAIDLLVQEIIKTARQLGCTQIIAFSVDKGTLKRSIKHGFNPTAQQLICLNLE
jgi:hypothetical protein